MAADPVLVPRDAATLMLVRDAASGDGVEVFMLRRNPAAVFAAGAHVFPGGAVDEADRHADLEAVCDGRSDDQASVELGVDSGGLAFWVAAVRESFEEAGLLLATDANGDLLSLVDDDVADRFNGYRHAIYNGEDRLVDVCKREGLTIPADRIHYFSHWITPVGAPRRYDTRFFITAAPAHQRPLHDDGETVASEWVRPDDALKRHFAGDFEMIPPTVSSLRDLARFDRVDALLAAAAQGTVATPGA
jgi:8-oxo-dGTP pyrophosphatase MutT (NUDIX family)